MTTPPSGCTRALPVAPEKNPLGLLIWRTNVAVLAVSSMAYSTNRAAPVDR